MQSPKLLVLFLLLALVRVLERTKRKIHADLLRSQLLLLSSK
jgi:hypothetical protein